MAINQNISEAQTISVGLFKYKKFFTVFAILSEFKLFDNGLRLDISSFPHMNIRMSTKGKRPLRSLTPSDKIHAIQRIHDGESKASVARDIGVPESTLRGWCKNEDKLRFMSRQSVADKLTSDAFGDKLDSAAGLLGPPEKRQRMDASIPLNFSNKMKYDDLAFKRATNNGIDFSTNKLLPDLNFNGLAAEYAAINGSAKGKVFGADISRPADPSLAAISPLSSLSHLSGLTSLGQSPLALSFNELTSNLNLLAQLNPGLSAMSGLNGLAAQASSLRNVKTKPQSLSQSPRSDNSDRQTGLTVKNWAKQKTSMTDNSSFGMASSQTDNKNVKGPTHSLPPAAIGNLGQMPTMADDPLLYWLKTQQAMLGLTNIYPPAHLGATSPPIRSSTPQQTSQQLATPPIASTPLTPSSTPSGSLDEKNAAWFNWCKAFGASLSSIAPNGIPAFPLNPMQQPASAMTAHDAADSTTIPPYNPQLENILYSQLTKEEASPSQQSLTSNEHVENCDQAIKPEDLSAKSTKTASPAPSSARTPTQSPAQTPTPTPATAQGIRPIPTEENEFETDAAASNTEAETHNVHMAECKDVLDNLLYKINNNAEASPIGRSSPVSIAAESESDGSYNSDNQHHHSDEISGHNNNNNNNSNKTDEEERAKCATDHLSEDDVEAIKHGEKFLQWLENCSNPRVTSVQLMQLRFLLAAIKSTNEPNKVIEKETTNATGSDTEELNEEYNRGKTRRRK